MLNVTNTLMSSTIMKTLAMDDFINVQTLALAGYAFLQTPTIVFKAIVLCAQCLAYAQSKAP